MSPAPLSSRHDIRRSSARVASDAPRSILSARSAGSATSAGPTSSATHLARRLLNPPSRLDAPLPPIILPPSPSTENLSDDVWKLNEEICDLIALVLRGYIASWYHKLSPNDKEFLPEISVVIITVIRGIHQRIQSADLGCLFLNDIPALVIQHYRDYRLAREKIHTSYASGTPQESDPQTALVHMFHNIQSHLAVKPDGQVEDMYLRQAVDHVLKSCLPPQDWASEIERSIIREVIVTPVLGGMIPRISQPWFLHSLALSLLGDPQPTEPPAPAPKDVSTSQFKLQHLIIAFLTLVQTLSTFCLNAIAFIQRSRVLIAAVNAQPPSLTRSEPPLEPPHHGQGGLEGTVGDRDYGGQLLHLLATMLSMENRRASSSILSMLDLGTGLVSPFLNKLLVHTLQTQVFNPVRISSLVVLSKQILFPNGYPGPPPVTPSRAEQTILREGLERRIEELTPDTIASYVLGPTPAIKQETIREILEPLSSPACNVHLVMMIFDVILLTLFPEMGIESITQALGQDDETGSEEPVNLEGDSGILRGSDDASGISDPDAVSMAAI